jgi:hypothetical protein
MKTSKSIHALLLLTTMAAAHAGPDKTPVPPPPPRMPTGDWLAETISPVTNPVFFEDPAIRSEIRPIFMHHRTDSGFATGKGEVNLYALQIRYAVTDRLAIIATKDGYIDIDLDNGAELGGWADVALGLKYALIDDRANQFILTPGFTFEIPLGNREVFQGNGDGELNAFVSAAKGFGRFHLTGNTGLRVPFDSAAESLIWHYSAMTDYRICSWFQPFVSVTGITVVDAGDGPGLTTEGYDLINFGSSASNGETQVVAGAGFRSQLTESLSFGIAYEKAVTNPKGLFDDRLTADLIFRF